MKIKAYAKINLSLDVVGVREDGYHLLEMVMQTIDLYDTVHLNIKNNGIKINSNNLNIPLDNRNLAYKAAKIFKDTFNIKEGADIYIEKNIPIEAGLAGGSSDAAAVLRGLRDIFLPNLSNEELAKIGVKIGADVPYCIYGGTALCEGIGEKITQLNSFKDQYLVLVKPDFGISTKDVYNSIDKKQIINHPNTKEIVRAVNENNLKMLCDNMINVLEIVTLDEIDDLKSIKEALLKYGAMGVQMTGSGPTIFGFFSCEDAAKECYEKIKTRYSEVYINKTI
ncbi:4-(cytidine 5'-diphospho)-2-C-methyl-D-erythritol kinase [Clostridium cochlearium]|uniref:4-diphosphocytidyl-2-C-methyl-D-erythritol kinase n=1 Tax=Clostridium cochlearium TaxID=1494 RepID=A0A239YZW0_CLOCO|nr:4-(cytidine 5'-diphospho)-2-C-methyl-D-erythritol kinase [Clostridium cochlearium]MBV1818793.1 4-(cytidine 5'-diphospho)-2-C-methyl-D-erythritol kinase [Bacteroidales bacterium MSK.15.36]NSJ91821.1 4-(cytidine 5'-diphospho)-2-C-methyl-D-erythritol kinase [Coprococcus sp. MSK.21.13]MBE6065532.1 4-(cytidine 5'-diphospho)-2-C-methyl-D-erythritol kinase [Clostridium cochlearium]MBU5270072.1 4-(cytidine 5'-diphospho)-2-C-methyl-D-erythritol kinase [Clostridium cochlearium]MCG4572112.1 4-(cytidin